MDSPSRPWSWRQTWHGLAFLHWPVDAGLLRPLVPEGLEIEEFEGTAWVAVTPFWMSGVTLRGVPAVPVLSRFPELNTRTYVSRNGIPGVWFFSLDAGSRTAVFAARMLFHLPYYYARMKHRTEGRRVHYLSERPNGPAFQGSYTPRREVFRSRSGSLEHWLTERYSLYARDRSNRLYRADIRHEPWPLQTGEAEIQRNTMLTGQRIAVTGAPHLIHFAARLDVLIWSPVLLDSGESRAKR